MTTKPNVVCYGEVLWDVFPSYKKIGGAPLNVAARLQSLGIETSLASAVGHDALGNGILDFLRKHEVSIDHVQILDDRPTSKVHVLLDDNGSASYDIKNPVAWDFISPTEALKEHVKTSDCFLFGSLACRNEVSRMTLSTLLKDAKYKVFDVNLRPPHYSLSMIWELMNRVNFIKLNNEEILEINNFKSFKNNDLHENIMFVKKRTSAETICVTRGAHGALLYHRGNFYEHPGFTVTVKDTVGAGDSFLAALVAQLLRSVDPASALSFACAVGALVASEAGANPMLSKEKVEALMNSRGTST